MTKCATPVPPRRLGRSSEERAPGKCETAPPLAREAAVTSGRKMVGAGTLKVERDKTLHVEVGKCRHVG